MFSYGLMRAQLMKTKPKAMRWIQMAHIRELINVLDATTCLDIGKDTRQYPAGDYMCTCCEKVVLLVLFVMWYLGFWRPPNGQLACVKWERVARQMGIWRVTNGQLVCTKWGVGARQIRCWCAPNH